MRQSATCRAPAGQDNRRLLPRAARDPRRDGRGAAALGHRARARGGQPGVSAARICLDHQLSNLPPGIQTPVHLPGELASDFLAPVHASHLGGLLQTPTTFAAPISAGISRTYVRVFNSMARDNLELRMPGVISHGCAQSSRGGPGTVAVGHCAIVSLSFDALNGARRVVIDADSRAGHETTLSVTFALRYHHFYSKCNNGVDDHSGRT